MSDGLNYRGAEKVEFLRSLVVDHVIDLTKGSVTESIKRFLKARKRFLVIGFASGEIPRYPCEYCSC